jgi:hypothetical protein
MKLLICLAVFAASMVHAAPVDRPWTHYNELLELLKMDRFYAVPANRRDKVVMRGVVKPNDLTIAPGDVVFTIAHGAERQRIQVDPDGGFDVPFNPDWVKSNPEVLTTIPAGQKAKFGFNAIPVLPQKLQFSYASLMDSVPQVNALIKSQAGMLRFLMPNLVGVKLQFPKASHATVSLATADGIKRLAADANGVIKLPLDQALLTANVPVTLSELPASADFLEN